MEGSFISQRIFFLLEIAFIVCQIGKSAREKCITNFFFVLAVTCYRNLCFYLLSLKGFIRICAVLILACLVVGQLLCGVS